MNIENKISKAVNILKEIQDEINKENKEVRKKILEKLVYNDNNYYYLIIIDDNNSIKKFKVYCMVAPDWDMAYSMCDNLIDEDTEYWLLHKDEIEDLVLCIDMATKNVKRYQDNEKIDN